MERSTTHNRVSGAFLILAFMSIAGILISLFYSGYAAILLGIVAFALAFATNLPESRRQRWIVFSLAATSFMLGCGAIALGVIARSLA